MNIREKTWSLIKRHHTSIRRVLNELIKTVAAVLIAYAIAIAIIFMVSDVPMDAIHWFIAGPFSNRMEFGEMLNKSVPLMFAGIAACVIIKAGQFNLFTEGAFYVGGLVSALIAIYSGLPGILALIAAVLGGGLAAALIGYVPAKLKASLNVNEFVSSIMMNFIVMWIGVWLISNVVIDPSSGDNATALIPESARMTSIMTGTSLTYGIFIAFGAIILIKILMKKTLPGYEIKMVGDNEAFAKHTGINTKRRMVMAQMIGIFIAGAGGATEILSNYTRFRWKDLPGFGFDGFMVTIIAKNKPLLVPIAALFIGYLRAGADLMAFNSDVAKEVVAIIQGIVILLVASERFFSSDYFKRWFSRFKSNHKQNGSEVIADE